MEKNPILSDEYGMSMKRVVMGMWIFKSRIPKESSAKKLMKTRNSSVMVMSLIIAAIMISCSLFYVWSHIQVVNIGYEISQANKERRKLLQLNKSLKLEIATLKSLHYVESIAKRDLRLMSPKPDQLVIIK
ncbi:MAG: cell division protein FtsL [Thermodesulfobacteriota bacterium]|nr:cell division protein FtsL [Thermodesulfobacteriota bacterium]